jgi:hypothetical protein
MDETLLRFYEPKTKLSVGSGNNSTVLHAKFHEFADLVDSKC